MSVTDNPVIEVGRELLNRSVAGVLAYLLPDGQVIPTWTPRSPWVVNLGLATRLGFDIHAHLLGEIPPEQIEGTKREIASQPPLAEGADLSQVPDEVLLAELYRAPGQWVLALRRGRGEGSYWEGTMWNGSALVCMGLAALLQRAIADQAAQGVDASYGHDPQDPVGRRCQELLIPLLHQKTTDPAEVAGVCSYMAYEAHRLREQTGGFAGTFRQFLAGGSPLSPEEPA